MPLYEYRCKKCGYRYEKIQKFNAGPEGAYPKCGGELERPLTAPALQFKGAGWYVNDYAPKGTATPAEKPAGDGGAEAKPSEAKPAAESKPAAADAPAKTTPASSGTSTT